MDNLDVAFKNIFLIIWTVIKINPGVIVPFLLAAFIAGCFKLSKNGRNLLEEIISLFF